jgi:hypothetical protein
VTDMPEELQGKGTAKIKILLSRSCEKKKCKVMIYVARFNTGNYRLRFSNIIIKMHNV